MRSEKHMKLTSDTETLAESKVLILYILDKLKEPATNDILYSIVLSAFDMNYFYFQQFLLDLIETKYVIKFEKFEQTVYDITPSGKNTLDLTLDILPGIVKLKADTNMKPILDMYEAKNSVVAEYTPTNERNFTVECKIVEHGETIFSVKTFAGSSEHAKQIVKNWETNAQIMYPEILNILVNSKKSES